jgi:N-acetylmuramoyl-L-alanine amidase
LGRFGMISTFLGLALALVVKAGAAPTFFIDPGHGAGDPGVHQGNLSEADIVFDIASQLQALLKSQGLDSVLSHDVSSSPALSARAAAANASGARAFISLHINSSPSPSVHGPRVFIAKALPPLAKGEASRWSQAAGSHSDESRTLAVELARALSTNESAKVSVQTLNLAVLKGLNIPAVMLELGFLSHAESRDRFGDSEYRKQVAASLAQGLRSWAANYTSASSQGPITRSVP